MGDVGIFEDALFTIFGHHQPARGDPGTVGRYTHAALPAWCVEAEAGAAGAGACVPGIVYRIADASSANTRLFAHHQWDAGVYLANLVAERPAWMDVRGARVVELGAGTGLPALVAAARGAAQTVVTDYPDPDVLANLAHNVAGLQARAPVPLALTSTGLAWGAHAAFVARYGRVDVVLAADVLWVSSQHAALLDTVCALLAPGRAARFVLAAGFHTGRPAVARFLSAARAAGLALAPDAPYGGAYERHISGTLRAWQGSCDTQGEEAMGDIGQRAEWILLAVFQWGDGA